MCGWLGSWLLKVFRPKKIITYPREWGCVVEVDCLAKVAASMIKHYLDELDAKLGYPSLRPTPFDFWDGS
jgi:hypothetical protein